jgi:sugar phosphate isomerase/epimerase
MLSRRSFLSTTALAAGSTLAQAPQPKIKIGLDNFAVRAMRWKAPQLIDYAAKLKCDVLFISDLDSYESLEDAALRDVKAHADAAGLALYAGGWSICPTSKTFRDKHGTAEEHLRTGIRVAKALGSPVYRVILGNSDDRKTPGGIRARIADTVKVLQACRGAALDAGVKIAVENHAGDLHSWELCDLIDAAGPDFVGANFDSGNAAWTLEDPWDACTRLGPRILCTSLRDDMIWETGDGAAVQWTAVGEGLLDWPWLARHWAAQHAEVPIMIETISGFSRNFPYKNETFWANYDRKPEALAKFEALARRGKKLDSFQAPEGQDRQTAEQEYQRGEIERSIRYLRETLGLGLKA